MANETSDRIRQKALRAARAVTMSAAIVAAGCAAEDTSEPDSGWELTEGDAATADASDGGDVADGGPMRCSGESDGVCPERCHDMNDYDCCEETGGIWSGGSDGACGIPGPFVPPSMIG